MGLIDILMGCNNKGEFFVDGEIYGVVLVKFLFFRGSGKIFIVLDLILK